jgi:hypothetical protein
MEPFQCFGEAGNQNDGTVTIGGGGGQVTRTVVTVSIFYLVSDGNDVTVTFCGNDAHL